MRERERLSIRTFREEIEAEERAEKERIEAPIRAAKQKLQETAYELTKAYRERLLGNVRDPDVFVDPAVATVRMTKAQAEAHNTEQFRMYYASHPDVYWGPNLELAKALARYWTKNGVEIATAAMFTQVIERMREYGLLPNPPAPEPEPEPEPQPEPNVVEPPKPEVFDGWDLESGEPRTYTRREVDSMDSSTYRRTFRIYREHLQLPTIGPGPRGRAA